MAQSVLVSPDLFFCFVYRFYGKNGCVLFPIRSLSFFWLYDMGGSTKRENPLSRFLLKVYTLFIPIKIKIAANQKINSYFFSTQTRGRTGMEVNPLVFETSASTDSAIWAFRHLSVSQMRCKGRKSKKYLTKM